MCRWSSQITSDCTGCSFNPSRPLSPPPPPSAPPLSHTPVLITILLVTRHMVIQGCFKTTSFDKIIGINFAIKPFYFSFPSLLLSRTFFATSFAEKNAHSFLLDNFPRNLFSRSFLCYNFSFFLLSHANYLYRRN